MLSKSLENLIQNAFNEAREQRHEFFTVEHLLLALLDSPRVLEVLKACSADIDELNDDLREHIETHTPVMDVSNPNDITPTVSFERALRRAILHAQSADKDEVHEENVLVALFNEQESYAVYLLKKQSIGRLDVVNVISHGVGLSSISEESSGEAGSEERGQADPLLAYADDLNAVAREGKIDPLIGRQKELQRTMQVICRRRKNNPLFVGEAGVGKTALAEGLAWMIEEGKVPEALRGYTIYALDLGALLAGTKYRGDFEQRFKELVVALGKRDKAILFIDEIHTIIGAGAVSGGVMDASNMLKPLLTGKGIRCMGATTFEEYRGIFEKDHALARRFQKIDVPEPTVDEAKQILQGLMPKYVEFHEIEYDADAVDTAVELSARYINERRLPDKAIDVIDEVGASFRLKPEEEKPASISAEHVESVISTMARIPAKTVSRSDKEMLRNLERDLKLVIFGQDPAVNAITSAIKLSRAGLGSPDKPIANFLFSGPTGVGKTEVTKQLAKFLGIELIRFDMSEYMESHTVSRLIGAPPGYVGYDQGGLLTEAVIKNPYSVVLLDEIEKAHPEIFNIMLQVMDHGTLTDNNGRKADFRNVIVIMTTNMGAAQAAKTSIGFTQQDGTTDEMEAIKRGFSPEFRNRLDAIIQFSGLDARTIGSVVSKFIVELEIQLEDKHVNLDITDDARVWLADKGYDPKMGARPMARVIQDNIKRPLADEILFGKLINGGQVRITVKDDALHMDIEPNELSKEALSSSEI